MLVSGSSERGSVPIIVGIILALVVLGLLAFVLLADREDEAAGPVAGPPDAGESVLINPDNYHLLGCNEGRLEIDCHLGLTKATATSGLDDYPSLPGDNDFLAILPDIWLTAYTAEYLADNDKYMQAHVYDSYNGIVDDYNLFLLPQTQGWPDLPVDEKIDAQAGAARLQQSLVKTYTYGDVPPDAVSVSPGPHEEIPGPGQVGQLENGAWYACDYVDNVPSDCYPVDPPAAEN